MAVNDRFMLPKRVRTMEPMADLLGAEEAELERTRQTVAVLEQQLLISTATVLLARYERVFGIPVNTGDTPELRRARIMAKLRGLGPASLEMLRSVAQSFARGAAVSVAEHFAEYAFEIIFDGVADPPNFPDLDAALEELKPAHLARRYTLNAQYRTADAHYAGAAFPAASASSLPRWVAVQERTADTYFAGATFPALGASSVPVWMAEYKALATSYFSGVVFSTFLTAEPQEYPVKRGLSASARFVGAAVAIMITEVHPI